MKTFDTVTDALNDLQQRGYKHDFSITPDSLFCDAHELHIKPDKFEVDEMHRFEGESDPGDESVVYAISSVHHALKGTLVLAFGTYAEEVSPDLLQKLRYRSNPG